MNWLNIHTDFLRSEQFMGSDPIEQATWLKLMSWCATQENGGIIKDCKKWSDRKWMSLCGCMADEVKNCDLFSYENDNLKIYGYPKEKEREVKQKRTNGKKGGRPLKNKDKKPCGNPDGLPHGYPEAPPSGDPHGETEGEGNGKEGEGKPPISPKGEEWQGVFPGKIPRTEKLKGMTKVIRMNEKMKFIGKWYNRREDTMWSIKEAEMLMLLNPSKEDVTLMNQYMTMKIEPESDIRRKNIETLLGNWSGELDRARGVVIDDKNPITKKKSW